MLQRNPVNEDDRPTWHHFGFIIYPLMISGYLIKKRRLSAVITKVSAYFCVHSSYCSANSTFQHTGAPPCADCGTSPVTQTFRGQTAGVWLKSRSGSEQYRLLKMKHPVLFQQTRTIKLSGCFSSLERPASYIIYNNWHFKTWRHYSGRTYVTHKEEKSISANFTHENRLI